MTNNIGKGGEKIIGYSVLKVIENQPKSKIGSKHHIKSLSEINLFGSAGLTFTSLIVRPMVPLSYFIIWVRQKHEGIRERSSGIIRREAGR